jgi:phospholipase C
VIQFMEKWTEALGTPAICPNISAWRRGVCGDLTGAFDFTSPVFGMPAPPDPGPPIGDATQYDPVPSTNAMPTQEPGAKRARPLPVQPNANRCGRRRERETAAAIGRGFRRVSCGSLSLPAGDLPQPSVGR